MQSKKRRKGAEKVAREKVADRTNPGNKPATAALQRLTKKYDRMIARQNTPTARAAVKALFDAGPEAFRVPLK